MFNYFLWSTGVLECWSIVFFCVLANRFLSYPNTPLLLYRINTMGFDIAVCKFFDLSSTTSAHPGNVLSNSIPVVKVVIAKGLLQINFFHFDTVIGI